MMMKVYQLTVDRQFDRGHSRSSDLRVMLPSHLRFPSNENQSMTQSEYIKMFFFSNLRQCHRPSSPVDSLCKCRHRDQPRLDLRLTLLRLDHQHYRSNNKIVRFNRINKKILWLSTFLARLQDPMRSLHVVYRYPLSSLVFRN